ncbi:hypothetical protein CK203_112174 [Vitis vinifera]|uniref:Uncharacterized protein n=1 Tax=Vitis vinifera TaxID=29760 RepID=A0A438D3D0_VITVI|nr:hypothetical protein CK203_112174 [Vitis vinifera]
MGLMHFFSMATPTSPDRASMLSLCFPEEITDDGVIVDVLVLRILRGLIGDPRGKFRPSWSGPYVIRELTPKGAAWLIDLNGNQFSEPTNVD